MAQIIQSEVSLVLHFI